MKNQIFDGLIALAVINFIYTISTGFTGLYILAIVLSLKVIFTGKITRPYPLEIRYMLIAIALFGLTSIFFVKYAVACLVMYCLSIAIHFWRKLYKELTT